MIIIFLRGLLLYGLMLVMFRLMGKRQVGELEIADLVTTLLLSEIAALPIDDPDIPLSYAVVPILLIMCLELIATFLQIKCNPMKKFFEGKPILLIAKGEIQVEALKNMRVSINELISECRQQGAADIGEVNYAILEPNGKLSVFPKVEHSPITPHVLSTNQRESGILHLLIADGAPQKDVMKKLEISMDDLKEMCQKKHGSIKEMLVFGINDSGDILAVSKKEKRK